MTQRADTILRRADQFSMKTDPVHETMRDLARRLGEAGIEYAVIGGIVLNLHGYERMTADVNLLMTPERLEKLRETLLGSGYTPAFSGAKKHFKNAETGVKVEITTTGEYPGDGLPKEVQFPDPAAVSEEIDGIRVIKLETLIELKLESGLSAPHRLKDLADVQQLIEVRGLHRDFAEKLNLSVRGEYVRLWEATAATKIRP
jgi:hypothetical protein